MRNEWLWIIFSQQKAVTVDGLFLALSSNAEESVHGTWPCGIWIQFCKFHIGIVVLQPNLIKAMLCLGHHCGMPTSYCAVLGLVCLYKSKDKLLLDCITSEGRWRITWLKDPLNVVVLSPYKLNSKCFLSAMVKGFLCGGAFKCNAILFIVFLQTLVKVLKLEL